MTHPQPDPQRIFAIQRPDPSLMTQYFLTGVRSLIFFPVVFPVLFFKYHTLRYRFDDEGVSMSWGLLFRREINLTYARIQDIHVSRGIVERWLGIATLSIQTASGNAGAEMAIQGLKEFQELRDFLYQRMRGRRETPAHGAGPAAGPDVASGEALRLLESIHEDLAAVRRALTASPDETPARHGE